MKKKIYVLLVVATFITSIVNMLVVNSKNELTSMVAYEIAKRNVFILALILGVLAVGSILLTSLNKKTTTEKIDSNNNL